MKVIPNLKAALEYARLGLWVLPLHWIENGKCSCKNGNDCGTPGKHPCWNEQDLPNGVHSASEDEAIIKTWWKRWPKANVGTACGKISGIIVADIDPRNGGNERKKMLPGSFPFTLHAQRGVMVSITC